MRQNSVIFTTFKYQVVFSRPSFKAPVQSRMPAFFTKMELLGNTTHCRCSGVSANIIAYLFSTIVKILGYRCTAIFL